ncbi:outer membrane protein [Spongiibacter sp. IMCC21906]|uniref:TolC family protein n=1 Tax=Spongiibacter sp. IMCC21906 TaxID=1620392 RepID=UPI00062DF9D3|nr:TolC family protein [Spongiibacter sp. IMCC21906]AKH68713.1 outer membrane protein [Spongiibacter sp. IMCC21906]
MIKKPLGSFFLLAAMGAPGLIHVAAAQPAAAQDAQTPVASQPRQAQPQAVWLNFLDQLKEVAKNSPEMMAEAALLEAEKESYYAERGDLGLELSLSHTRYPEGSGSSSSGSGFTALEEYSEARISIDLMHLLARRSSSIDSAKARVESAEYEVDLKAIEATIRLMEDAVTAWTYGYRREALNNALASIEGAKSKLKLSEQAAMPEITKATPTKVAEAIILHSEINNNLKAISSLIPNIPPSPNDFSVLPITPPDGDDIYELASQDLNAQILKAESLAYKEKAESLRGNGVSLSLYGGFVEQETQAASGTDTEDGPQYGAQLTVPLGSNQHHLRKKAEFEAHAAKLGALAAVRNSQRSLVELRDHWAEAVARMNQSQENMRQQAALLSKLRRRAGSPGSGQAPEPWEVDMQAAVFWTAVANVWEKRAVWVTDALTWGLLSPEYLQANARTGNAQSSRSLCAPYVSCDEIAGN